MKKRAEDIHTAWRSMIADNQINLLSSRLTSAYTMNCHGGNTSCRMNIEVKHLEPTLSLVGYNKCIRRSVHHLLLNNPMLAETQFHEGFRLDL